MLEGTRQCKWMLGLQEKECSKLLRLRSLKNECNQDTNSLWIAIHRSRILSNLISNGKLLALIFLHSLHYTWTVFFVLLAFFCSVMNGHSIFVLISLASIASSLMPSQVLVKILFWSGIWWINDCRFIVINRFICVFGLLDLAPTHKPQQVIAMILTYDYFSYNWFERWNLFRS